MKVSYLLYLFKHMRPGPVQRRSSTVCHHSFSVIRRETLIKRTSKPEPPSSPPRITYIYTRIVICVERGKPAVLWSTVVRQFASNQSVAVTDYMRDCSVSIVRGRVLLPPPPLTTTLRGISR